MKHFTILSIIIGTVILLYGSFYWHKQTEENVAKAREVMELQRIEEQKKAKSTWLGKLEPSVVLIGSSVTYGTGASDYSKSWAGQLEAFFKKTNEDVTVRNLGVGGYTTDDVIKKGVLQSAINQKPDVIIFETCLLNDYSKLSVEKTKANIKKIILEIMHKSPKTRLVIMPPNQIDSVSYISYVKDIEQYIKSQNVEYIDYWDSFNQKINNDNISLQDTLSKDGIHPNDKGYYYWFKSIEPYFTK